MRFLNAARLAYGLNSCKAFGLDSTNCDIYDGTHLTIIADYNQDSLKLTIVDVNEVGAFPSSQIRLDQRSSVEPLEVRMMDETWGALVSLN
jgi:hypothetical protein